jgi:hypothetical protein
VRVEKGLESKLERRPRYERDSRRELASLANDGAEVPLSAIEWTREFERSEGG